MIVLDASVVVELLTNGPLSPPLRQDLATRADELIVPHLLDIEGSKRAPPHGGRAACRSGADETSPRGMAELPAERYAHPPLLARIWELRHNFTAYDAAYIALAEAAGAVLYTCDEKLATGYRARVTVFSP